MKMLRIEKFLLNKLQSKKGAINLIDKLMKFVEHNGQMVFLEVGCGGGFVTKYLAEEYRGKVTGVDIDPLQIELAKKGSGDIKDISYFEADATNLPFGDRKFDIILSVGVLHHMKDWLDALKEIKRVLKPGGYFLYADIVYPERITTIDKSSNLSFGLVTIDIGELNSFFDKFGFTTIYSQWKNRLVCKNYEAVYRKN
ncbi:MAG: class I SAM-dependent methyltransferase [Dehalococcoidia bacterium]|nr:MAG: class I SAM-dependent methyltransferase [Dehalococcoidia bacterium]